MCYDKLGSCTSFFRMGLRERHLKRFIDTRIYITILFENIPQLCLQLWFLLILNTEADVIVILAMISSIVSIALSLVDVVKSASIVRVKWSRL